MRVTLENYKGSVLIGGREICNLRFAYDIDLIAGTLYELQLITNKLTFPQQHMKWKLAKRSVK